MVDYATPEADGGIGFACNYRVYDKINYQQRTPSLEKRMSNAPMCEMKSRMPTGQFTAWNHRPSISEYGVDGSFPRGAIYSQIPLYGNDEKKSSMLRQNLHTLY